VEAPPLGNAQDHVWWHYNRPTSDRTRDHTRIARNHASRAEEYLVQMPREHQKRRVALQLFGSRSRSNACSEPWTRMLALRIA
jgi:hypothetical protein